MSRTLSGLFLVGSLNGPRKRKGMGKSPDHPEQIGKIPEQIEKGQKRTKKGRTSPDWETPPFEPPPCLAALESCNIFNSQIRFTRFLFHSQWIFTSQSQLQFRVRKSFALCFRGRLPPQIKRNQKNTAVTRTFVRS